MDQSNNLTRASLSGFLEQFNDAENISAAMTMAQVRAIESQPISALVDRSGDKPNKGNCYKYLIVLCDSLTTFFGEKWADEQMKDCSRMLYENYYFIRSADWVYFAKKAKSLHFGKVYGKFSPATLMEWVERFAGDWTEESINLTISAANESKSIENDSRVNREILRGVESAKNAYSLQMYKNSQTVK